MGYGGIFKTVFRVAASVVGGLACGPPCAAIGSAVATAATGGSFKEALMAGATSYIGASISQGVSGTLGSTAGSTVAGANPGALVSVVGADGFIDVVTAGQALALQSSGQIIGGIGAESALSQLALANAGITSNISQFTEDALGSVNGVNRTSFDVFANDAQKTLTSLGFDASSVAPVQFDALGSLAGGYTELTLNQALLDQTGAFDDILAQKFSPQQIQNLRQEARNALSQKAFDDLLAGTTNPGLADDEFSKVIAAGVERENIDLGKDITEAQFNERFSNPNLGQTILTDEENLRKDAFNNTIGQTFTGKAFDPIDDDIISSIVNERSGPARQQVSNFAARGNLNPIGGRSANEFLTSQEEGASNRVRQVGDSVLGGTQQDINFLGDEARSNVSGFKLGDDLFDVTPFAEQRQGLISDQQGTLKGDITSALGSEPLFDINRALQSGGRAQGSVSGTAPNQSFLDAIAAREGSISSGRNRRGLGSRGSGAF